MKAINKKTFFIALSAVGVLLLLFFLFFFQTKETAPNDWRISKENQASIGKTTQASSLENDRLSKEDTEEGNRIVVDIKGAIHNPGVYEMKRGDRINQIIEVAGGLTSSAEGKAVNFATILVDQQLIYIPTKGEEVQPGASSEEKRSGDISSTTKKININQATLSELQRIKGVGEKKAQAIIDYRTKKGKFSSIDQLAEVDGFGKKTVDKLRDSITI